MKRKASIVGVPKKSDTHMDQSDQRLSARVGGQFCGFRANAWGLFSPSGTANVRPAERRSSEGPFVCVLGLKDELVEGLNMLSDSAIMFRRSSNTGLVNVL